MKAILISIHSQWVELILNFIKKDEIRKGTAIGKAITRLIKEQGIAPMLVYCTKDSRKDLASSIINGKRVIAYGSKKNKGLEKFNYQVLNGKVVARFNATADLLELKMIEGGLYFTTPDRDCFTPNLDLNENAQMDNWQLLSYTGGKLGTQISDIHINNLEIFDRPKELSEFKSYKKNIVNTKINGMVFETELDNSLIKAPQSWCYVEVEDEE